MDNRKEYVRELEENIDRIRLQVMKIKKEHMKRQSAEGHNVPRLWTESILGVAVSQTGAIAAKFEHSDRPGVWAAFFESLYNLAEAVGPDAKLGLGVSCIKYVNEMSRFNGQKSDHNGTGRPGIGADSNIGVKGHSIP